MKSPGKILVVGPSWVGDMIMAQSLLIKLKQQDTSIIIDVLAPAWCEPLLSSMPEVRKSIIMPLGHGEAGLFKRYQIGKSLRTEQYDRAIVLPNSFKSALIPFWAKIPERVGFKGEMRYGLINKMHHLDKTVLTMTVQRYASLANEPDNTVPDYPKPKLKISQSEQFETLKSLKLDGQKPVLALCPGAEYGPAKCWPAEYYADIAKRAIQKNWQVWILGSEKDRVIADKIKQQINDNNCLTLAGETTLQQVMVLLSLARQVVSNDSGLMHVAAAVQTPVVAIYGSSDPNYTPPLNDNAKIAYLNLECSPCFKRECPLGHLDCLNKITPDQVWNLLDLKE